MKKWFIDQFDGNGSSFPLTISRHVRWLIAALAAGGLLSGSSTFSQTPTASLIYTATGPIQGGVAAGPDGALYLESSIVSTRRTDLSRGSIRPRALSRPPSARPQRWIRTRRSVRPCTFRAMMVTCMRSMQEPALCGGVSRRETREAPAAILSIRGPCRRPR